MGGNIRTDFKVTAWEDAEWIYLSYDRNQWRTVVNTEMNLRVP